MPISPGFWEWGCPCHCSRGGKISFLSPRAFLQQRSMSGNPRSRQRCSLGPWHCLQFVCSVFGQLGDWSLLSYSSRRTLVDMLVEVSRFRLNFCRHCDAWRWHYDLIYTPAFLSYLSEKVNCHIWILFISHTDFLRLHSKFSWVGLTGGNLF